MNITRYKRVTLGVAALLSTAAVIAAPAEDKFQMAVLEDARGGRSVLHGNYERAIDILANRNQSRFSNANNLCVAYTVTRNFEEASVICDRAVEAAERNGPRDQALARSNRGVLKAVSGDIDAALADFDQALELEHYLSEAIANHRYLMTKVSKTASL